MEEAQNIPVVKLDAGLGKPKRKRSYYTPQPIQPTPLQRNLARVVAEVVRGNTKVKTSKEILLKAGYSVNMAEKPALVSNQRGTLIALAELGLTKEKVVPMLMTDLENNPGRRWLGLSIAGKWLGLEVRDDKPQNMAITNAIILIQPKE